MNRLKSRFRRHRFLPAVISHAIWLYYRFSLRFRDEEDLLAERGIIVSYESIRLWSNKFGPKYANRLRRQHQGFGDTFFIDEVFVMRRFNSTKQAQRFVAVHAAVCNLFNLGRYLVSADHYRDLRQGAFASWRKITLG